MPDTALKNAMLERDRIASEINKFQQQVHDLKAQRQSIDDWISAWHRFAGTQEGHASHDPNFSEQESNIQADSQIDDLPVDDAPERTRTTGNPKKEIVAAAALEILKDADRPISRADLHKELALRGVLIEGKDPEQVLSTMLWRTRETFPIIRVPSGGYWIVGKSYDDEQDLKSDNDFADSADLPSYQRVEKAMFRVLRHYEPGDLRKIYALYDFGGNIPKNIVEKINDELGYPNKDILQNYDGKALGETFVDMIGHFLRKSLSVEKSS